MNRDSIYEELFPKNLVGRNGCIEMIIAYLYTKCYSPYRLQFDLNEITAYLKDIIVQKPNQWTELNFDKWSNIKSGFSLKIYPSSNKLLLKNKVIKCLTKSDVYKYLKIWNLVESLRKLVYIDFPMYNDTAELLLNEQIYLENRNIDFQIYAGVNWISVKSIVKLDISEFDDFIEEYYESPCEMPVEFYNRLISYCCKIIKPNSKYFTHNEVKHAYVLLSSIKLLKANNINLDSNLVPYLNKSLYIYKKTPFMRE